MTKIGIIICARYQTCGGGKCLRAMRERRGGFAAYPADEPLELVGYSTCGGCPGGNVEYVPLEFLKNGAEVVHLATGLVVGYPPCPHLRKFKAYIETAHGLPVVVGTHPIPQKYLDVHERLDFWRDGDVAELAAGLLAEPRDVKLAYD
ncbi:MAG: CGGC domain-containing protein [Desulfovibrionaceae bacterium]